MTQRPVHALRYAVALGADLSHGRLRELGLATLAVGWHEEAARHPTVLAAAAL